MYSGLFSKIGCHGGEFRHQLCGHNGLVDGELDGGMNYGERAVSFLQCTSGFELDAESGCAGVVVGGSGASLLHE